MPYQTKIKCPRCFIANDDDRRICRNCNTPLRGWRRKVVVKEDPTLWNLYDQSQKKINNIYNPTIMLKKRANYQ